MENRSFQLDNEWNIVQYPEKPTGFGVLIIGDERHFVDECKSFWMQNEGKQAITQKLREAGYTIFTSNLYGRNWGSDKAVELSKRLYHHILKSEILNGKIHVLAEGMGALVALRLLQEMNDKIRSVALINPILSLTHHLEQEREHKFFYKKILRELSAAHQEDSKELEARLLVGGSEVTLDYGVPISIYHILAGGRAFNQSKWTQKLIDSQKNKKLVIQSSYLLPEKKLQLGQQIIKFYKKHENQL